MSPTVEIVRTVANPQVRPFQDSDLLEICSWVTSHTELQMVSGDAGGCLTPDILRSWLAKASQSLVLIDGTTKKPVGFCTLSKCEAPNLPPDYIEMCHLLINPRWKYVFITARLLDSAKSLARGLGYHFGCARVVPLNRWALLLTRYEKAEEFTGKELWTPAGFRWFRLDLR